MLSAQLTAQLTSLRRQSFIMILPINSFSATSYFFAMTAIQSLLFLAALQFVIAPPDCHLIKGGCCTPVLMIVN